MKYFACRVCCNIFTMELEQKKCEAYHDHLQSVKKTDEELDSYEVTIHICKDCQQPFTLNKLEKEWYKEKVLSLPVRCKSCRSKRNK